MNHHGAQEGGKQLKTSHKKRILILSGEPAMRLTEKYAYLSEGVAAVLRGKERWLDVASLDDLVFDVGSAGMNIYSLDRQVELKNYALVVFQQLLRDKKAAIAACVQLLQTAHIPYIDPRHTPIGPGKINGSFIRAAHGLPFPRTIFAASPLLKLLFAGDPPIDFPLILKDNYGHKGKNNFLVHNHTEFKRLLNSNPDIEFIVQEFIPNAGDYRLLVMGGQVKLVIHRQAANGSHLNNTSQGGAATLVELSTLPKQLIADALRACQVEGLVIAGVDIICDKNTGQHYILETNSSPQLGSGAFVDCKLAALADYLVGYPL